MRILRLVLANVVLAGCSYASAETMFITGSTAFRSAANATLYSLFGGNLMASDKSSTTSLDAGSLLFTNCPLGGQNVDISVYWSGSEAGIQTVASGTNCKILPFLDRNLIASHYTNFPALGVTGGTYGYALSNSACTSFHRGDIAFSDIWQDGSIFNGLAPDNINYNKLKFETIGVVPFTFVASKNFPWNDITDEIVSQAATDGFITGNLFSGLPDDINTKIWFFGRNPDSGTRLTMLAVTKIGIGTSINQMLPTIENNTLAALCVTPQGILNGIRIEAGDNGEASGGKLSDYLTHTFAPDLKVPKGYTRGERSNYAFTYMGCSDAARNYANGLVPLTYNGIEGRLFNRETPVTALDRGFTNIITGRYPFWSYEHIAYAPGEATPRAILLVQTLAKTIKALPSTSPLLAPNIALKDMYVQRLVDGGPMRTVSQNGTSPKENIAGVDEACASSEGSQKLREIP